MDILENEGSSVLKQLDFSSINTIFIELKTSKRGRPYLYDPDEKLKAFLYGLAEGKRTIRRISRCILTFFAQMFLQLDTSMSYATLDRFWHQLSKVAEQVFEQLVEHIKQLGVLGNYQAADITSIATSWLDDPDATCSYDATKGSEGDLQSERIKKTFRKRSSVENTNNVLKQLGLEDLRVKGG